MNKRIKCVPFPDIGGAYVVVSAHRAGMDMGNGCTKCMSFFFAGPNGVGAEWEPDHGPITKIYSCEKEHPEAQPHWFYDYYTGQGNWAQLAVKEEMLPRAFIEGDYVHIFGVLKSWAIR